MTRERVGAARDGLARLGGGPWGRGFPESPPPKPGPRLTRADFLVPRRGEHRGVVQADAS